MFAAAAADFTSAEIDLLTSWSRANGLEVAVEALGSDLPDEVAYIGQGFGTASWTIHGSNGRLWLSLVPDWAEPHHKGWTIGVGSVKQAMARISGMIATGWR